MAGVLYLKHKRSSRERERAEDKKRLDDVYRGVARAVRANKGIARRLRGCEGGSRRREEVCIGGCPCRAC